MVATWGRMAVKLLKKFKRSAKKRLLSDGIVSAVARLRREVWVQQIENQQNAWMTRGNF